MSWIKQKYIATPFCFIFVRLVVRTENIFLILISFITGRNSLSFSKPNLNMSQTPKSPKSRGRPSKRKNVEKPSTPTKAKKTAKKKAKTDNSNNSSITASPTTSPRQNWPQLKLPRDSMYLKIEDLDPGKTRYYIHGRVEKRSELTVSSKQKMMTLWLILADETADIKITLFGDVARRWDSVLKEGHSYVFNNLKIYNNQNKMNYTMHRFQGTVQKYSVIEERASEKLSEMKKKFYIKPERNIFDLLEDDHDEELKTEPEDKQYQAYDLEGVVFKVKLGEFQFSGKVYPKVEAWISNGANVIMISVLGDKVAEFRGLFNPSVWDKLIKGFPSVKKTQVSKLNCFFRNLSPNYYRHYSLQLQSKAGEVYLKPEAPNYALPIIPRTLQNYSQTFLELPGNPNEIDDLSEVVGNNEEGTYIVKANVLIGEMDSFSYAGVPGDNARRKVTMQIDGRFYCQSNDTYYTKSEEFYRVLLTIRDCEASANALVFDRAAKKFFGKNADELVKLRNEKPEDYEKFMQDKNNTKAYILLQANFDDKPNVANPTLNFVIEDIVIAEDVDPKPLTPKEMLESNKEENEEDNEEQENEVQCHDEDKENVDPEIDEQEMTFGQE